MEKLDRAEPSAPELQLPAGRVQAEQPSPHPPIVLYRDLKGLVGLRQQGEKHDWSVQVL